MNILRSQSDMESGRIRTTMGRCAPHQPCANGVGGNRDFGQTPALTKEMLKKLQNTELGPQQARLCGYECNARQLSLLIALIALFGLSSGIAYIFWYTELFRQVVLNNLVIANNTDVYNNFLNPSPSFVNIYIYNYTNVREVASGAERKLRVKELGPFTYEEKLTRVNVSFNEDATTMRYQEHRSYRFLAERSAGMQSTRVTVPNIPMLSGAAMFRRSYFLTRIGLSALFKQLNAEPFLQVPVDRLVLGYDDELFSLARGMMPLSKQYPFERFGLLAQRQGLSPDVLEIYTGKGDIDRIGTIRSLNNKPFFGLWTSEECDNVHGIDGYFNSPSRVRAKQPWTLLTKDMCHKAQFTFTEERRIGPNGRWPAYRFQIPENAYGRPDVDNVHNQGYCAMDGECPPQGTLNLTQCAWGTPLFFSLPHFLYGDPKLREAVEGISEPDPERHRSSLDVHPSMGFIMQGWNRLQTNVQVQKSFGMTELGMFEDDMILPVVWWEFGADASDQPANIQATFDDATFLVNRIDLGCRFGSLLMVAITFLLICLRLRQIKAQQ